VSKDKKDKDIMYNDLYFYFLLYGYASVRNDGLFPALLQVSAALLAYWSGNPSTMPWKPLLL
jgi:hypothetical protein